MHPDNIVIFNPVLRAEERAAHHEDRAADHPRPIP
jgi:hypothetical protein